MKFYESMLKNRGLKLNVKTGGFNTQSNLTISKFNKDIYLVKHDTGEDFMIHSADVFLRVVGTVEKKTNTHLFKGN